MIVPSGLLNAYSLRDAPLTVPMLTMGTEKKEMALRGKGVEKLLDDISFPMAASPATRPLSDATGQIGRFS